MSVMVERVPRELEGERAKSFKITGPACCEGCSPLDCLIHIGSSCFESLSCRWLLFMIERVVFIRFK